MVTLSAVPAVSASSAPRPSLGCGAGEGSAAWRHASKAARRRRLHVTYLPHSVELGRRLRKVKGDGRIVAAGAKGSGQLLEQRGAVGHAGDDEQA